MRADHPVTDALLAALAPTLAKVPPGPIGVAVSGGGDSVALLLLLQQAGRAVEAVTIDHGLRPESGAEAAGVAAFCAARGIAHTTLRWTGWDGRGNLQDQARRARRALIADWARGRGLCAVALGHTLDDQAETVLLRLARGSGVDGLAAMQDITAAEGMVWLRPMLGLRRAALRAWLTEQGVSWVEDPGNANADFARVRARQALEPLAALGIDAPRLAATAASMARARTALDAATAALAAACLVEGAAGEVTLDPEPLAAAPREIRLRLLAAALCRVAGARYRPRLAALEAALAAVEAGLPEGALTLHGCLLRRRRGAITLCREPAAVAARVQLAAGRWDGRWAWDAADLGDQEPAEVGAVGLAGLALLPDWRAARIPREVLATTPALWRGARLLAAPFASSFASLGAAPMFRRIPAPPPLGTAELWR